MKSQNTNRPVFLTRQPHLAGVALHNQGGRAVCHWDITEEEVFG